MCRVVTCPICVVAVGVREFVVFSVGGSVLRKDREREREKVVF